MYVCMYVCMHILIDNKSLYKKHQQKGGAPYAYRQYTQHHNENIYIFMHVWHLTEGAQSMYTEGIHGASKATCFLFNPFDLFIHLVFVDICKFCH